MPDRFLSGYEEIRPIDIGVSSAVYLARQSATGLELVVKRMPIPDRKREEIEKQITREQEVMTRLGRHGQPFLPEIVEFRLEEEGSRKTAWLVMSHIKGETLKQHIEKQPKKRISDQEAKFLLRDIGAALSFLHSREIIHRDVKPGNIIKRDDGTYVLVDLGIAREIVQHDGAGGAGPMTVVGTPLYMSPEIRKGRADGRADLFSLGVTLYECVTGDLPWGRDTIEAACAQNRGEEAYMSPQIFDPFRGAIRKMLRLNSDERYRDARDLLDTFFGPQTVADPEASYENRCAWYFERGDLTAGRQVAEEGLARFPNNARLHRWAGIYPAAKPVNVPPSPVASDKIASTKPPLWFRMCPNFMVKSLLILAATLGMREYLRRLLAYGARPNGRIFTGNTPLYFACEVGHADIVQLLIDNGAVVDLVGKSEVTPLAIACEKGHLEVVKILLSHGADVNSSKSLPNACFGGHVEIVKLLLSHGAQINHWNALQLACDGGHFRVVEMLLDAGADVNMRASILQQTPLHIAVKQLDGDIVNKLLMAGASVDAVDRDGVTPLHIACDSKRKHLRSHYPCKRASRDTYAQFWIVGMLCSKGPDVHARFGFNGLTALHLATENGCLDLVEILLKHGADPNFSDKQGRTSLHYAVYGGHFEIVQKLLCSRGDVNRICDAKCFSGLIDAVLSIDHPPVSPLDFACWRRQSRIALLLIEGGASVDGGHPDLRTPLYYACMTDDLAVVKYLISHGAKLETTSDNVWSPLHAAAASGHHKVVEFLLEHGASVHGAVGGKLELDEKGRCKYGTPLHVACLSNRVRVVNILLNHGADVNLIESHYGETPLDRACTWRQHKIRKLLIAHGAVNSSPEHAYKSIRLRFNESWFAQKWTSMTTVLAPLSMITIACFILNDLQLNPSFQQSPPDEAILGMTFISLLVVSAGIACGTLLSLVITLVWSLLRSIRNLFKPKESP